LIFDFGRSKAAPESALLSTKGLPSNLPTFQSFYEHDAGGTPDKLRSQCLKRNLPFGRLTL